MPARKKAGAEEAAAADEEVAGADGAEQEAPSGSAAPVAPPGPASAPTRQPSEILGDFDQRYQGGAASYVIERYRAVALYVANQMPDRGDSKAEALEALAASMKAACDLLGAGQPKVN